MTLGPSLDQAVLWPLLEEYRRSARERRRLRTQPHEAEHVWAYMTRGGGDAEFVVGLDGHPMMDTDRQMVELAPVMEEIARQTGWTIRLVRFDRQGTSIATIAP